MAMKEKQGDKELFNAFRVCNYLNISHVKEFGVTTTRMKNFIKNDYVEKCSHLDPYTKKQEAVFKLTKKGQKFAEKQFKMKNFYSSNSATHDLRIADQYCRLEEDLRWQVLTETDLRDRFEELYADYERDKYSMPDVAFPSKGGGYQCLDIITDNYGKAEIQSKVDTAEALNMDITLIKC